MSDQPKPTLRQRAASLWDPVWLRSWGHRYRDQRGFTPFAVRQLQVFMLTARSLYQEKITLRAAALTYHTLLSIVPLLAVAFALFKAFGGLQRLEGPLKSAIAENLAVGRAEEVMAWLEKFVENINAGAIAGVGVLILIYSAVGLLTNMEKSLNEIWATRRRRSFFVRFAIFWCLITLTPMLMGYSISLTARFQSSAFASGVVTWLPFGLGKVLLSFTSVLSVCVAFTLLYLIVPAAKVRVTAALAGGTVGGIIWSLSKYLFINLTAGSMKYSAIYGALGVLPLLMIWMYISWIIVLFGATFAFATQSVRAESLEVAGIKLNTRFRERLALRLCVAVAAAFRRGDPPPTADTLIREVDTLGPVVRRVLDTLCEHGVLTRSEGDQSGFVPGRDIQEQTLASVVRVLREQDGKSFEMAEDDTSARLAAALEEADAAGRAVLEKVSLRDLA